MAVRTAGWPVRAARAGGRGAGPLWRAALTSHDALAPASNGVTVTVTVAVAATVHRLHAAGVCT